MKVFATKSTKSQEFFYCPDAPVAKIAFVTKKGNFYAAEWNSHSFETKFLNGIKAMEGIVTNVNEGVAVMSLDKLYSEWKSLHVLMEQFFHSMLCQNNSGEFVYFVRGIDRDDADEILDFQKSIWRLYENTVWEMKFFGHVQSDSWDDVFSSLMSAKVALTSKA